MAIVDRIQYEGSKDVIIWKHPAEDFNTSAQLIVGESQQAFIVRNGEISQPYGKGKHTIQTENIPFLRNVVELVTGGVSPNSYEVFYVNLAALLKVYWGTATPWCIQDPNLQVPFNIKAYGQYYVRVVDGRNLLLHLVGTSTSLTEKDLQSYFNGYLMGYIQEIVAKTMYEDNIQCLELPTKLSYFNKKIQEKLNELVQEFGISIKNFAIESIGADQDEVFNTIREIKTEAFKYERYGTDRRTERGLEIAEKMAENPGPAGAANMMGGFAMGAAAIPATTGIARTLNDAISPISNSTGQATPQQQAPNNMVGKVAVGKGTTASDSLTCPSCGKPCTPDFKFCPSCGADLESHLKTVCPKCGKTILSGSMFCSFCGEKIGE